MASQYTVTFKDINDNIIDTQTVSNGENASLTNIYKTGKLITNLSEDYRNITSDKTIIVTYTDIQGTDINNRMLFANALYNDEDDYDLIEVDKYSLSFYPKRVYGNIGFDFLPEWGGKDITISVSEMSSNAQIIIYDYSIDDVYAALNYPNKSITINVPNDKVNSIWVCLQARDTNICWATDICILVDNEPYTVTFKDTNGTVLKTAQTGYVNLLNHYGQKVYSSFTKLNNSISNNNDWYSWYIIDFSDYIGSRLKISSTVTFNADESINGYDAGVYSWDSNDRNTENFSVYWTTPGTYVLDLEYFPTEESHFLSFEGGNITYSNLSITSDKNNCVDPPTSPIRENKLFIGWNGDYTNVTGNLELTAQYIDEQGINSNNALLPFTEWAGQWNVIDIERKANSVSLNTTTAWGGIYTDYPSEFLNKDIMFNISAMSSNASLVIQDATDYSALLELTNENRSGTINLTSNSNIRIVFQDDSNTGTIWLTDLWACDVNYLPTVLIAEYKFNNTLYDLIPEFNAEFTDYTYEDIVNGEVTTRTIYSKHLPTIVRFGTGNASSTNRENSLLEILELKTDNLITMSYMFANCENLTYINSSNWNTSNVTEMIWLFVRCRSLRTIEGINNWDTKKVTNMDSVFNSCSSLTTLDLSNWNTSNVTDMGWMFEQCSSLTSLDVSNWDTSKVTVIDWLFVKCYSLRTIKGINNWNINQVSTLDSVFNSCSSITILDLSNWNISNVTDMGWMFYNCNSLSSLDLSNWNTANVDYIDGIFSGCSSLKEITMYNSDVNSINEIIGELPTRTSNEPGKLYLGNTDLTNVNISDVEAKYWKIITEIIANKNMVNISINDNNIKGFKLGNSKTHGLKNIWFTVNPLNYKTNLAFLTPKVASIFFNGFINPTGGFSNLENEYGAICINLSKYIGNNIRIRFSLSVNNGGAGIYLRETDIQETDYTKELFSIDVSGEYNIDKTIYVTNSTKYMWIEGYNVEYNDLEIYGMGSSKFIPTKYNLYNELTLIQPENYDSIITDSGFKIDYNDYTKVGIDLSKYINKAVRIKAKVTVAGSEAAIYLRPSNNCDDTFTHILYGKYDCVDTVQENIDLSFVVSDFNKFIWFEGFYVEYSNVEIYVEGIKK